MSLASTIKIKGHLDNIRLSLVVSILVKHGCQSVVEVGCGDGTFAYHFARAGIRTYAIDIDCAAARKLYSHPLLTFLEHPAETIHKLVPKVEAVHMGEVLEHVKDPKAVLDESLKYTQAQSKYIVSVPNFKYKTHLRTFSMKSAYRMCESYFYPKGRMELKHRYKRSRNRQYLLWGWRK